MFFLQTYNEFSLIKLVVIVIPVMHMPKFHEKVVCNNVTKKNKWSYKVKSFFEKWNGYMAVVMAVVLFALLIGVVIYDIVTTSTVTESAESTMKSRVLLITKVNPCKIESDCRVECTDIQNGQFVDELINELQANCTLTLSLKIQLTCSSNCVLPVGWLGNLSSRIELTELSLNWSITDIQDGAFNNYPFQRLTSLIFEDSRIRYLRRSSFTGLRLNNFAFRFVGVQEIIIEEGLLTDMSGTLQVLQLNHCFMNEDSIKNLTSANEVFLGALEILDLSYNTISTLPSSAFYRANALRSLYLVESSVVKVDVQAFLGLSRLQLLHLDNNFISTLQNGTLNMIHSVRDIYLHNNFWNCTCELQWLKDFYLKYDIIKKTDPPKCYYKYNEILNCWGNSCNFENVKFCNESSNENAELTSSITDLTTWSSDNFTATTPSIGRRLLQINCTDVGEDPIFVSDAISREYVHTQILNIRDSCMKFDFYELDPDPLIVEILISGDITGYHLLWFNSHLTSDTGCITNLSSKVFLNNFKRNQTYTVCLIYQYNESVSPYDCFGFQVRVEWPYRCFIINKWIELVLSLAVILPLVCCFISALIMFYCIRQNPTLIKGNKRVIIVRDRTTDAIILPKDYDRANYPPPPIDTYSQGRSSYLTANYHQYARVKYNYRPPILRSVSEESVFTNSYINPQEPTQSQLRTLRMNVRRRPRLDEIIRTQNEYEEPPALPPLNNTQNKILPTEENLYTSV